MKDLIEKLKAATDGSRELDVAVWNAVNPDCPNVAVLEHGSVQLRDRKLQEKKVAGFSIVTWTGSDDWAVPSYTTSMDAAMKLLPERYLKSLTRTDGMNPDQWFVVIQRKSTYATAQAATPELAICAVALEAS
jgi:hypothetical protein